MWKVEKIYLAIMLVFISGVAIGQELTIDVGFDKVVCVNLWDMDTVTIGGNPTATGGVGQYQYFWETEYKIAPTSQHTFYASYFLSDTSIANPKVIADPTGLIMNFKLTVIDEEGNSVTDSVNVHYSKKMYVIGDMVSYIGINDSVGICSDQLIGSSLPLDSISWMPSAGLTNPDSICTWANPESTTYYTAYIRDTAGCYGIASADWVVVRMTSDMNDISVHSSGSLIKYISKYEVLEIDESLLDDKHVLRIYNLDGRIVYNELISSNQVQIKNTDNKVLIYNLIKDNEIIETGKILTKQN